MNTHLREAWHGWRGESSLRLLVRSMARQKAAARPAYALAGALAVLLAAAF